MTMIQRDIRYAVHGVKNRIKHRYSGAVVGDISRYLISEIPFTTSVLDPMVVCYNEKNCEPSYDESKINLKKRTSC